MMDSNPGEFSYAEKEMFKIKFDDAHNKVFEHYDELIDDLNDPIFLIHTMFDETMMSIKD